MIVWEIRLINREVVKYHALAGLIGQSRALPPAGAGGYSHQESFGFSYLIVHFQLESMSFILSSYALFGAGICIRNKLASMPIFLKDWNAITR